MSSCPDARANGLSLETRPTPAGCRERARRNEQPSVYQKVRDFIDKETRELEPSEYVDFLGRLIGEMQDRKDEAEAEIAEETED